MSDRHEHEHEHGAHEHDHDHGAEEALIDSGTTSLTLAEHDGSLVATYKFTLNTTLEQAQERVAAFAADIAREVNEQGGLVGHVKAVAREAGAGVRISVTFDTPDIVALDPAGVRVEGVAIVLAVDREWFEQRMIALVTSCVNDAN